MPDPEWMSIMIGLVGGFLCAVFAEPLRQWLYRPIVALEFKPIKHFVTSTREASSSGHHGARYVRINVTNRRSALARSCRAYLVKIECRSRSGEWEATEYCESMQLAWSARGDGRHAALDLPKNVPHFVDVVSTRETSTSFKPETDGLLFRHMALFDSPGTYRFTVVVSGDGVNPVWIRLLFVWSSKWDDFQVMVA